MIEVCTKYCSNNLPLKLVEKYIEWNKTLIIFDEGKCQIFCCITFWWKVKAAIFGAVKFTYIIYLSTWCNTKNNSFLIQHITHKTTDANKHFVSKKFLQSLLFAFPNYFFLRCNKIPLSIKITKNMNHNSLALTLFWRF